MPAVWTTPSTWVDNELVTASKLNTHVRDNLTYLYDRPKHIITINTNNQVTGFTSTTFAAINDGLLTLTLTTTGRPVELNAAFHISSTGNSFFFDWLIDDTIWASSGTTTALTGGVWRVNTGDTMVNSTTVYSGLAAGTHTFRPRIRVSASSWTIMTNATLHQFSAEEI